MKKTLFLFQDNLEALIKANKVTLDGNVLYMPKARHTYLLTPAVKVISCETSPTDPFHLVGKFIPADLLATGGADLFICSFIYKKHSYKIEAGFIGTFCEHQP
jgi:hypothetical protein